MDLSESMIIVFNRIQKLEPENASKIIGYLLVQEHSDREMIRLAFGPDNLIFSLITKAKNVLRLSPKQLSPQISPTMSSESVSDFSLFTPFSPASSRSLSSPPTYCAAASYWDQQVVVDQQLIRNMDFNPQNCSDLVPDDYHFQNQSQFLSLDDQLDHAHDSNSNCYYPESALGSLNSRINRRSGSLPEFPLKICHYFNKGFCKHGSSCRYFHGQPLQDRFSQILNGGEFLREESVMSPGSLEKLELELIELLRSRRGLPVSIASLPMMYYEKYGRNLQAEGYLTESQRHGKAGYSLTKLLARLKNSIRLIDRPHGQHSVVLAEDAPNYMEYRGEMTDSSGLVAGSRQIYLTFPADSTFTEEDVSNYFKGFGPVQDVRIPCQQKRMFGFVTFVYPETVKIILSQGNPHFVCGARVLVKPYREKSRLVADRKYSEKIENPMCYPSHFLDVHDPEDYLMPRVYDTSRLLRKQFIEEQEQSLELERRRLSEMHLATKQLVHQPYLGFMDDVKLSEGYNQYTSTSDRFSYFLDMLNSGSATDVKIENSSSNYCEQEGQGIILPESPFASQITNSIPAVI
ncbi:hypothetical protein MKW94_030411 [Papaver nudicaule]|uniref:Zinc finger CCCH domain-containing protein 18-like n=1 Tax=Papaver nudicaule TaxID=74823 RepID=A0AA41W2M1_PAPNU|nr:hypothetical protein [Papaver nudicaule]